MKILGLTDAEVAESKAKYGDNSMTEQKGETFLQKLWGNFQDPMIRILCFALIVNVVLCVLGQADWFEPIGITAAILIATLVSTYSRSTATARSSRWPSMILLWATAFCSSRATRFLRTVC